MQLNIIELFSGSGTVSEEFRKRGHNAFSIDIRRRKGICEPSLRKNIIDLTPADIPFSKVHAIWASLPCTTFSYASGGFHYKGQLALTDLAIKHIKLVRATLEFIAKINPKYYFIENPRGKMRYLNIMTDWLIRNNGMIKELTMSSYGFNTPKPTDIFTNAHDITFKPLDPFGRGAKYERNLQDNFTTNQRQKTPALLAKAIAEYVEMKIENEKQKC